MTAPRNRKRVLIVDDLPEQRDILATLLRFHGYEVMEAGDGAAGVAVAIELQPDLVLMDVVLPVLDGWSATQRLKADDKTAKIPIIIVTARAFIGDRTESSRAGAEAYLSKPCEPIEVLQTVQRLIGGGDGR